MILLVVAKVTLRHSTDHSVNFIVNPGLHVRRKNNDNHKHKHNDVYTCDKHKHTQAQKHKNLAAGLPFGARFDSNMAKNGNAWVTRMYADNLSLFFSFLSLHLCLCLRRPSLHVRRNDGSTSTNTREWKSFYHPVSRACACVLVSYV